MLGIFFFTSASLEMALPTISDPRPIVGQRDLLSDVTCGVARLNLCMYGSLDIALSERFFIFSHVCHEEVCPGNICLGYYILDNGDSTLGSQRRLPYYTGVFTLAVDLLL
jgi:hypothetical protein